MQTIQFGNRYLQIPTTLTELSTKQLVRYVQLINAELTITQFNVLMLLNLLDVQHNLWLKWFFFKNEYLIPFLDKTTFRLFPWKQTIIDPEDFHEMTLLSAKFHDFKSFVVQNPVLKIFYYLKGPDILLQNICFRQFRKAEEYFAKYHQTHEEKHLDTLLAWLYVPIVSFKKLALSPKYVMKRANTIAKLPLNTKMTIYYFYLENRNKIAKMYKYLYNSDGPTTDKKKVNPIKIKLDFERTLRSLSGNINQDEQTDFQPAHAALAHLNDKAEEIQKLKEHIDKNKS